MGIGKTGEALRDSILDSIKGRKLGLDVFGFLVGGKGGRVAQDGWSSAGSTITSTSVAVNLMNHGLSVVGATGASGTTAYNLDTPYPGVRKTIFNPTTGVATIGTGLANIASTGSAASTYATLTFNGKGAAVELMGLTTALWALLTPLCTASTAQPWSVA